MLEVRMQYGDEHRLLPVCDYIEDDQRWFDRTYRSITSCLVSLGESLSECVVMRDGREIMRIDRRWSVTYQADWGYPPIIAQGLDFDTVHKSLRALMGWDSLVR